MSHRLILVYWPGAGWTTVSRFLDAGLLPHLSGFLERGALAGLDPFFPFLPDSLFASVVTGLRADGHGILGPADCDPRTGTLCAPLSTTLRAKTVWQVIAEHNLRVLVAGCSLLYPVRHFPGIGVAREIFLGMGQAGGQWTPPPEMLSPPEIAARVTGLCLHPEELGFPELAAFLPDIHSIPQQSDPTVRKLSVHLSQTASLHAIATSLMESEPWDFAATSMSMIDAAHGELRRPDEALQRHLLETCYRLADQMLGRLSEIAGTDTTFAIVSAGGPEQRGFLCLSGPETRRDVLLHGAGLLDVAPTLLYTLRCPIPSQLPGRPLTNAFDSPHPVARGASPVNPPEPKEPVHSWAAPLHESGYRDPEEQRVAANCARVNRERTMTLSDFHLTRLNPAEAVRVLEEWREGHPADIDCLFRLCYTYLSAGRVEECRAALPALPETDVTRPALAVIRARLAIHDGQPESGLQFLYEADRADHSRYVALTVLIGCTFLDLGRFAEAESAFARVIRKIPDCWPAHQGRATALRALGRLEEAAEALRQCLRVNFTSTRNQTQLAFTLLALGDHAQAAQALRVATTLR